MSLFEELKRRNVFRVGIAYAVAAWIILQATDVIGEILDLPQWGAKLILVILGVGFLLALFFAWAFELTPEGVKRESEVDRASSITPQTGKKLNAAIMAMLVVALGYFIWESRFAERVEQKGAAAAEAGVPAGNSEAEPVSAAPPSRQSIAVLPFANRSRLEEDAFFVEGIHDDLLTNLARIGSLKVISRTSVLRYQDTQKPIPEIAGELGVATIMEGAVQRSGNTVRVNVQLIDAITDEHLWAEIFDRELTADNLFAIQSEVSTAIARALEATLTPREQQLINERPTENLAAYNAYLRGRQLIARRNSEDLTTALAEFQRAVALDSDFALAWVGVAETAFLLPGYSSASQTEMEGIQEHAAQRALEINGQLGEAHLAMATLLYRQEQNEEAEAAFKKAIELSPNYAPAYQWYSDFIVRWRARRQEAMELTRKAVELDPLAPILQLELAEKLWVLDKLEEAEKQTRLLIDLDPGFVPAYDMMATIKGELGQLDEKLLWQEQSYALDLGQIWGLHAQAMTYLDLQDLDGVSRMRTAMEEIDPQHVSIGWLDAMTAAYSENYAASLESIAWVNQTLGYGPNAYRIEGFYELLKGDYQAARASFERAQPRLLDATQWPALIEERTFWVCGYAFILQQLGEDGTAGRLLRQTLDYIENELPKYVEDPANRRFPVCYAVAGQHDEALLRLQAQVSDGRLEDWWLFTRLPWFDPLRGEPGFKAMLESIETQITRQRENVRQRKAAEAL